MPGSRDTLPKIAADTLHKDSVIVTHAPSIKSDSLAKLKIDTAKKANPAKRAALLSAILPGAGQAYNKKYWKMPIVYGALAIPTITFIYNNTWYKRTKYAYTVVVTNDTADFKNINVNLQGLLSDPQDLQIGRASCRERV